MERNHKIAIGVGASALLASLGLATSGVIVSTTNQVRVLAITGTTCPTGAICPTVGQTLAAGPDGGDLGFPTKPSQAAPVPIGNFEKRIDMKGCGVPVKLTMASGQHVLLYNAGTVKRQIVEVSGDLPYWTGFIVPRNWLLMGISEPGTYVIKVKTPSCTAVHPTYYAPKITLTVT